MADVRVRDSLLPQLATMPSMESTASNNRFSVRQQVADPDSHAVPDAVTTAFVYRDDPNNPATRSVAVTGSFRNWAAPIPLSHVDGNGLYVRIVDIPPGEYLFRFYVDGAWKVVEEDPNLVPLSDGTQAHFLPVGDVAIDYAADDVLQEEVYDAMDGVKEVAVAHKPMPQPERSHLNPAITINPKDTSKKKKIIDKLMNILWPFGKHKGPGAGIRESEDDTIFYNEGDSDYSFSSDEELDQLHNQPARTLFPGDEEYENTVKATPGGGAPVGAPPNPKANIAAATSNGVPNDFGIETKGTKPKSFLAAENNAMGRQEMARAMYNAGNYDGALAMYGLAIKLREENQLKMSPNNVMGHLEMGITLFHLEEFKAAEKHFRLALGIWVHGDPLNFVLEEKQKLGDLLQFLGVALDRQRNRLEADYYYREAINAYDKHDVEGPNVDTCYDNLALVEKKLRAEGKVPGSFKPVVKEIVLEQPIPAAAMNKVRHLQNAPVVDKENSTPQNAAPSPPPPPPPPQQPRAAPQEDRPDLKPAGLVQDANTWHALADKARATMPADPLPPKDGPLSESEEQFEKMAEKWVSQAKIMHEKQEYSAACDLYILAVFARRRGGRWWTNSSIDVLLQFARMLLRTGSVGEASHIMQEVTKIIGAVKLDRTPLQNGKVFSLYASVLRAQGRDQLADQMDKLAEQAGIPRTIVNMRDSQRNSVLFSRESISKELRRASGLPSKESSA